MKNLQIIFELHKNLRADILEWLYKHSDKNANSDDIKQLAPRELKETDLQILFFDKDPTRNGIPKYHFIETEEGYELALNMSLNNEQYDTLLSFFSNTLSSYIKEGNRILGTVKSENRNYGRKVLDFKDGKIGYCEHAWY